MELRVIQDAPASGAWNMSLDEALLESAARGMATLRFYQWSEPTLSLGYFQKIAHRAAHPASAVIPVVRRTTGGGAIVHDIELTYSLTIPTATVRSANEARFFYDAVHRAAVSMLAPFGVPARLWSQAEPQEITAAAQEFLCFQRRAVGDLVAGSSKLLGSAQRRSRGALLQHGSLLLGSSQAAPELPGLDAWTAITPTELVERWVREIGMELASTLPYRSATDEEYGRAELIQAEKFASPAWTERR